MSNYETLKKDPVRYKKLLEYNRIYKKSLKYKQWRKKPENLKKAAQNALAYYHRILKNSPKYIQHKKDYYAKNKDRINKKIRDKRRTNFLILQEKILKEAGLIS